MATDKKTISFRTNTKTHGWITKRAKKNGRSVNSEIEQILLELRQAEESKK